MTREERAKQFQPFDAMKGLQEALRDREERHARVAHRDIGDEAQEKNSETFARLQPGMRVRMDCYVAFHEVTLEGRVTAISTPFRFLKLDGEKIFFSDIYDIEITEFLI